MGPALLTAGAAGCGVAMDMTVMKLLGAFLVFYLAFTGLLFVMQRKLQYFPDPRLVAPAAVGLAGFTSVNLETPDGERLVAWQAPARDGFPTIVYFQGNGAGLAARADRFWLFNRAGYGVLALGYRGYSGSTGEPTETGLVADGAAAVAHLAAAGVPPGRLVFYGESLGSGVAVPLAANQPTRPAAVILEAPFTSAADVARRRYWYVPVGLLMKDQFRSMDHIASLRAPLFIVHGDADAVVPLAQGQALFAAAGEPKELMVVKGGGHGMGLTPEVWERMDAFLKRHAMARQTALP